MIMCSFKLSEFGEHSLVPSPVNQMTASFSKDFRPGIDINLGVGYVNDETIPHAQLEDCFHYVLHHTDLYKNSLNYGSADGSTMLKNAIRSYYIRNAIGGITKDVMNSKAICVGANGATSILDSFAEILPKGIVVTAEPNYYIYTETLVRKGFEICAIPEDEHGLRTDFLEERLLSIDCTAISFFYIVTVNNPSSIILSNSRRKEIVAIGSKLSKKLGRKIPVIFDKAYEDIIFDVSIEPPRSGLMFDEYGIVIEIGTLSKIIAPALRIGYAIADDSELMKVLIQKTSDIGFSAPLINEEMASRFIDEYIDSHALAVRDGYRKKSDLLKALIQKHLGMYLERFSGGQAGFYFYLTFRTIETHSKSHFYKFLSRTTGNINVDGNPKLPRLIYVPGEFCVSPNGSMREVGSRQLRISYGFEDVEVLERAILLMRDAAEYVVKQC